MQTTFSSVISQSSTQFELTLTGTDYSTRKDLYDSGTSYYIRRTLTGLYDTSITSFTDYSFTITYSDHCRSATINS